MAVLIKNITTYQKTKPTYEAYRKAKDRGSYRAAHERDIILHEAAAKAIKGAGIFQTSRYCRAANRVRQTARA